LLDRGLRVNEIGTCACVLNARGDTRKELLVFAEAGTVCCCTGAQGCLCYAVLGTSCGRVFLVCFAGMLGREYELGRDCAKARVKMPEMAKTARANRIVSMRWGSRTKSKNTPESAYL
jgi:hypothetical protein